MTGGPADGTIGVDGLPVIAYFDKTAADLKVLPCGNTVCSAGVTIATLDSAGDVGRYASLAVGADGVPTVAYQDIGAGLLKVARPAAA